MSILTEAGFTGRQRDVANRSLMVYLIGSIQFEYFGQLSDTGTAMMDKLSGDEYPLLVETAQQKRLLTANQEFRKGLDIVLDGLEASLTGTCGTVRLMVGGRRYSAFRSGNGERAGIS